MLWITGYEARSDIRWSREYSIQDLTRSFLFIAIFLVGAILIHP